VDPISALALVTTVWGGIKKAVEVGREVQDVMGQLSQWAQAADVLEQAAQSEPKKPSLFKKLSFGDDTKQAFDAYAAKVKIREMEAEIRHEFLYGGLNHLGMDGLKEFYNLRRQIRERRIKMLQDQKVRRQKFIEMSLYGVLIAIALGFAGLLIWTLIALLVRP
jgi:hypothetical protein